MLGLLDCHNMKTCRPGSGPSERKEGAAREEFHDEIQMAYYNGWKKMHGLKMLTVLMPNGLSAMAGPWSMRTNDLDSVNMSNLDNFLNEIQIDHQHKYSVYGDGIFHDLVTVDSRIRSYHREGPFAPLTQFQEHENKCFKKVRMQIEFTYGDLYNKFKVFENRNDWKLMNQGNARMIKFIIFIMNCHSCLHANNCATYFNFPSPSLEEYLYGS